MSSLIEERLLTEIEALQARLSHLETAEGGVADSILDGLIVYDHDYDTNAAVWTIAAAAGVWETDPSILANLILPVAATIFCVGRTRWRADVVSATSMGLVCYLDGATQGDQIGYLGEPAVDYWMDASIVNRFTGVAAGNHTVTFQARRLGGAVGVDLQHRHLWVVAIQA